MCNDEYLCVVPSLFPSVINPVLFFLHIAIMYTEVVISDTLNMRGGGGGGGGGLQVSVCEKSDCVGVKRLLGAGAEVNKAKSDVSDIMFD